MPKYQATINGQAYTFDAPDDEAAARFADEAKAAAGPADGPQRVHQRAGGILGDIDAAVRGAADVVTFGAADEIAAGLGAATGIGGEFGEYDKNLALQRGIDKFDEKENPVARTVGQVAGGVGGALALPFALPSAAAGLTVPGRIAVGGLEGAVASGAHGFGSGEGGPINRLQEGIEQAPTGAAFGAGGAAIAPVIERAGRAIAPHLGFTPPQPQPAAAAEFGIPVTHGQQTGNIAQQALEQELTTGGRGASAQNVMQEFGERQRGAIDASSGRMAEDLAGAPITTRNPSDLGGDIHGSIQAANQASRTGIDQAYTAAREAGGAVDTRAVTVAPAMVRQSLEQANIVINPNLTPVADTLLSELDNFGRLEGVLRNNAQFTLPGPGDQITGVTLEGVEGMRSLISRGLKDAANPADRRAIGRILDGFDTWVDNVAEEGLLQGGEEGMRLFQRARGMRAEHGRRFESSPRQRDADAGRIMQKMIDTDATPDEVANALVGVSRVGEAPTATRLVRRLQTIMGADSPEFGQIRQLAWEKMVSGQNPATPQGAAAIADAIERVTQGRGTSFGRALYTPEQLDRMARYGRVLRQVTPARIATNPSGTAAPVTRALNALQEAMGGIGGAAIGAFAGGVEGAVIGAGTGTAMKGVRSMLNQSRARAAIRGAPQPAGPLNIPSLAPVRPGAMYGTSASQEDGEPLHLRIQAPRNR